MYIARKKIEICIYVTLRSGINGYNWWFSLRVFNSWSLVMVGGEGTLGNGSNFVRVL